MRAAAFRATPQQQSVCVCFYTGTRFMYNKKEIIAVFRHKTKWFVYTNTRSHTHRLPFDLHKAICIKHHIVTSF